MVDIFLRFLIIGAVPKIEKNAHEMSSWKYTEDEDRNSSQHGVIMALLVLVL
jgi:hypothetical protein